MKYRYRMSKWFRRNRLSSQNGVSLLEVLLAGFITGILAVASFNFYTTVHNQSETQTEVSEIQHLCRASLHDIKKTMRMAGYKLPPGHPPYEISGDTLAVYYSETQPVDTVLYFLQEFNDAEYARVAALQQGRHLYNLMKQVNSGLPAVFANYIVGMNFKVIDSANVQVGIASHASKQDEKYAQNNGYRMFTLSERIHVRNMAL